MLIKEYYKNCAIYSYEKEYTELAKKILDNDYSLVKELKNTKRNYVSLIKVNNQNYIYKEARNEYIIPQRKLMTIFKNGEALETLKNVNSLIQYGFTEYIKPLIAVNKREKGMINFSFLVMEYIEGKEDREQIDRILEKMKEIHKKGYYHGDFNPSNFLFSKENKLYILDTQGKKMLFGTYRAHYDMLTMIWDSFPELDYPYSKDMFYYLAAFIKKIKKLKFIKKIKEIKKTLREKGWKI